MNHETPSSPFLWLLMFKCEVPVRFYCLIARTLDRVNLQAESFFGKLWGKFGFVGERVSYARCCGRRVPRCAARVVCCSLPTQRPAHSSISCDLTAELSACPLAWKGPGSVSKQTLLFEGKTKEMEAAVMLLMCLSALALVEGSSVRNIFWNTTTAARLGGQFPIVTVNEGNQAWEYDQVNIICPVYKEGEEQEQHIIYSVEKEEFEHCRVTSPRPRIVAICNRPRTFMYFTLTFRSFTPTPGGLEFRPGQDYYFVSTSSRLNIHRRVGGYCSSHNMRMIFRVAEREEEVEKAVGRAPVPTPKNFWAKWWNLKAPKKDVEEELSNYVDVDAAVPYERHPKSFRSQASPLQSSAISTSLSSSLLLLLCTIYILNPT